MITASVEASFKVSGVDLTPEALEAHVWAVADALMELTNVSDQDVAADLGTNIVTITLLAFGDTESDVLATASAAMRSAIHVADGCTPDWPSIDDAFPTMVSHDQPHGEWNKQETVIRRVDLVDV